MAKEKHSNDEFIESVYFIIKSRARVKIKDLDNEIGGQYKVRCALKCLIKEQKIKRIRALGFDRIDHYYQDISST
jgi:hypothetical protein